MRNRIWVLPVILLGLSVTNAQENRPKSEGATEEMLLAWTVTGTFGDQQLPQTLLSSTVWARRNGKWLAVHHQDTELKAN
jgi:hypothetical protein